MHLSLNVKFILAYIAFAILSFVGISTLTSRLMLDNATRTRASSFYQEGVYLSNQYVETYFDEETTKGTVSRIQTQLSSLSVYLNAHIWLVSREGEIMIMFAKGRNLPYVQEELCLSKSTVSTHRQHIYQKLGVHSAQEMIDLIQKEKG